MKDWAAERGFELTQDAGRNLGDPGACNGRRIDAEGLYPFVSHSFASVDMGQVGLLKVGHPKKAPCRTERSRRRSGDCIGGVDAWVR